MITYKDINDESYTGRLGNQILDIASLIGIANKNNTSWGIESWNYNRFFKYQFPEVTFTGHPSTKHIQLEHFGYSDVILDNKYNYVIDNHFFSITGEFWAALQSYKFFEHCLDTVKYWFEPNFYLGSAFSNLVGIHVRRGDYTTNSLYFNLGKEYYQEAMSHFTKKRFVIFSDDPDFCKKSSWFPKDSLYPTPAEGNVPDHILDWQYIRTTESLIIANSSFSLSAAYLSNHKKVVAPKNWFTSRYSSEDLYKPDWIMI